MHKLQLSYRSVPALRKAEYDHACAAAVSVAEMNQSHFWRFRNKESEWLEFIESSKLESTLSAMQPQLDLLEAIAPSKREEWDESKPAGRDLTGTANDRTLLGALLRERSVKTGDFVLASGERSNVYVDCRLTTMHSLGQRLIGTVALELLDREGLAPYSVGGLTMGADPIAYAIAHSSAGRAQPIEAFSVRKEAKDHGRGRQIEGCFEEGKPVVLIEDVITSGGSAERAFEAITKAGAPILAVLALVDREAGGRARLEALGIPVYSIFQLSELI